jgi:PAS domain S-box-containing protein
MARAQILVADRDPGFAGGLAANLESLGYAVTEVVSSPEEALQKAEENRPDLVLLDLGLLRDGKKGKAIRQLQKSFPQGLVYLVPEGDQQTLQQARITHSFDYLRKACDSRELETIIDMALYRRQGQQRDKEQTAKIGKITAKLKTETARHQRLEEALQAERKKLFAVLDTLPAYVVLLAPDYSVPYANREFEKRFGAAEGRKCYDFLFGRTSPCPSCETFKVLQTNAPHEWEWTGPDGRDYQIYDFPFPDTDGSPLILETGVDVTVLKEKEAEIQKMAAALRRSYEELEARVQDRTQDLAQSNAALQNEIAERLWSEKRLRDSEERYRLLVDLSPDAIAVYSQERLVFINPAAAQLFGAADPREILDKPGLDLIHPEHRDEVEHRLRRLTAAGGRTKLREIKLLRLDGRVVDVEAAGVGITFQGQAAVQVVLRDITARKRAAQELEHQASFPRLNPNPVLEMDVAGNITYANAASLQALEKLGLENLTRAFLPPDLDEIMKAMAETGETVFYREVEINGAFFGESISFPPEFEAIRIYARDITRQKRAEIERQEFLEKLQASEEELQVQNEELHAQAEELLASNQDLNEAHEALGESQNDLNRAQAVAHTGSWRLDVRKNELLWSDETYRIFGITQGTPLTYEAFLTTVHPEDREYVDREWTAALRGEPYDIEHRIVVGDTVKWVREKAELEFDSQGKLLGGFGTTQDITGRKQAEQTIQTSRDFLEIANRHTRMAPLLQDYAAAVREHVGCEAVAVRILDEAGNIPYAAYTGFSEKFVASESPLCIKYDQCLCINVVKGATDPGLPCYSKGSSCYINNFSHVLATTPPGLLGKTRNVCHHFGYESVALIPIIFGEQILGLIHLADRRENMVPLSLVERLERIGLQLGTAINRVRAEEGLHQALIDTRQRQDEISALLQATRAVLDARTFPEISRSIYDSCKELIGASSGYIALLSQDGQENEVIFLDTGNRRCTVDSSLPMPIRGLREKAYRTGSTVYDNNFSGSDYAAFLPGGHVGLDNVMFSPLVVKGKAVGLLGLGNKPGGYNENDARLAAGFGELAAVSLANKRAEEERERLIRELETERARLQAIIASAPEAIVVADANGSILMTNPAADQLYTHPDGGVKDAPSCALFQLCHADGADCILGDQPLLRSAREGETIKDQEMVLAWPDGRRRDLLVNTAPIRDPHGNISGAVGLFQDITQRKRAEEKIRKLNAELGARIREVSERTLELEAANKELEAFSYSVSHDLRTPLRAIEGFARMLIDDYAPTLGGEGLRLLEVIRSNTRIMGDLIDDLLALSRLGRQEIRSQELDLGGLVTSVFGELKAQEPERQMELVLNPLPPAFGDRNLINQVLVNLLGNAVKFTKPREKAIIEVGGWTEGKENIYFIKDNGVGFDMRYVGKIFGVFQRLHRREDFEGTGVGLAIVQRIINRHGGRVWATGKVDRGAEFYFALPGKGEGS